MIHQLHIGAVELPQIFQAGSEIRIAIEIKGKIGKAASKGVPPYVNDFRAGQHKVDQSHIRPVVRHLVGEDRAIRPPVFGRGPKIIVAQRRSEEHTSELQSLMRISNAVYCLKQNITYRSIINTDPNTKHTTYTH